MDWKPSGLDWRLIVLPVEEEFASWIRNHERRLKRLETLDQAGGDWVLIETILVSEDGDPVEFFNIPQTFRHLFVLYSAGAVSLAAEHIQMVFNANVGANYHYLGTIFTSGGGVGTDVVLAGATYIHVGRASDQDVVGNRIKNFAAGHIFIPDYTGNDNYKTVVFSNHYDSLGALEVPDSIASIFGGGTWEENPPIEITEIDFTLDGGVDFREGTVFSLYGVN
jgi:hypothetical protein